MFEYHFKERKKESESDERGAVLQTSAKKRIRFASKQVSLCLKRVTPVIETKLIDRKIPALYKVCAVNA